MMRTMAHPPVLEGYLGFSRALNIFSNYFNKSAAVEVDFPRVALGEKTLAVTR